MADDTSFAQRFVFVDERAALGGMTLEAGIVSAKERNTPAVDRLCHIGRGAFDGQADMRIMAISATDFAFKDRVMMWQLELCADFEVTLEARLWRPTRIDDGASSAATGNVQTPRAMARFAPCVLGVIAWRL